MVLFLASDTTTAVAPAQNQTGSINGTILDSRSHSVPGADVYLKETGGKIFGATTSDKNASYRFEGIPPGAYTIIAQIDGKEWIGFATVAAGFNSTSNIVFPDYVYGMAATPKPVQAGVISLDQDRSQKGRVPTITPTPRPVITSVPSPTAEPESGDFLGGIISFFKSLLGM